MKISRRQYDEEFKRMAVELSLVKGSLKIIAEEIGITPQILTRWRRERLLTQANASGRVGISQEQQTPNGFTEYER